MLARMRTEGASWWRHAPFWGYLSAQVLTTLGNAMQSAALGWELYERTSSKWVLGIASLMQVLPVIALVLVAGHVVDRYPRKRTLLLSSLGLLLTVCGLMWASRRQASVASICLLLFLKGMCQAFTSPARAAVLPRVLPVVQPARALASYSGAWQFATALGPALAGGLLAWRHVAWVVYGTHALLLGCGMLLMAWMVPATETIRTPQRGTTASGLWAGFQYVAKHPLLLGAVTLDLFAVLLGGATNLLPVFAKDILHVGPAKLGWLQAAPGLGALLVGGWMAVKPLHKHAGVWLFGSVALFGIVTIVFGVSRWFALSFAALVLIGLFDNISVVIRSTIEQWGIPDVMRGKVSAVVRLFIGLSNELGGFESGVVAALLGPVACVVIGGVGSLLVVAVIAAWFPSLRRLDGLTRADIQPLAEAQ